MKIFLEGFFLQASLILALGAQNLFVLESGLKRQRHYLVAIICSLCDVILIGVGVAGAASIFIRFPVLKIIFGILGVSFLFYYGLKKLREAQNYQVVEGMHVSMEVDLRRILLLTLGFSLLNPHVYLDTVILIGGYSSKFTEFNERARFGAGAAAFSVIWFFSLTSFASLLNRFLSSPKAMKIVALVSGLILVGLSWKLGKDVYSWISLLSSKQAAYFEVSKLKDGAKFGSEFLELIQALDEIKVSR